MELHEKLNARGFDAGPGDLTENTTIRGADLVAMPPSVRQSLSDSAIADVTELRNP